jgi:hypothetical protein
MASIVNLDLNHYQILSGTAVQKNSKHHQLKHQQFKTHNREHSLASSISNDDSLHQINLQNDLLYRTL